jgi:hypothetical protein
MIYYLIIIAAIVIILIIFAIWYFFFRGTTGDDNSTAANDLTGAEEIIVNNLHRHSVSDKLLPNKSKAIVTNNRVTISLVEIDDTPTLHGRCSENSCGGELICDLPSRACRQPLGGRCVNNVDCASGLYCQNWTCVNKKTPSSNNSSSNNSSSNNSSSNNSKASHDRTVHWAI